MEAKKELQTVPEGPSAAVIDDVRPEEPPNQEAEAQPPLPVAAQAEASGGSANKEWTVEEDDKILAMREEAKEWSLIAAATGKTETEVEARCNLLAKAKAATAEAKGKEKADDNVPPAATAEGPAEIGVANDDDDDDKSDIDPFVEGTKATKYDVADATPVKLEEIEQTFDLQEITLMIRLHDSFDNQKWQAIASRFFDETGRRIKPEVLRLHFGNLDE